MNNLLFKGKVAVGLVRKNQKRIQIPVLGEVQVEITHSPCWVFSLQQRCPSLLNDLA